MRGTLKGFKKRYILIKVLNKVEQEIISKALKDSILALLGEYGFFRCEISLTKYVGDFALVEFKYKELNPLVFHLILHRSRSFGLVAIPIKSFGTIKRALEHLDVLIKKDKNGG